MTSRLSEDVDMTRNKNRDDTHHYDHESQEDAQPQENVETDDNTQVVDAGIPGQIQYPDREVYAERAAAFAAGKVPTLYEEDEENLDDEGNPLPGDETGEETEPAAMRGMGTADREEEEARDDRA